MKIPQITDTALSPVTARPGEAGRVWRAARGLGAEGERLALTIAQQHGELLRKKKTLNMTLALGEIEVDLTTDLEDLKTELRRSPDPDTYYSDWETRSTTLIGRRLAQIVDPETRARAEILVKRIQLQEIVEQKHYENLLWGSEKLGKAGKVLTGYQRTGELEKGLELIDSLERNGLLTAVKAEEWRQLHKDKVAIMEIRATDPSEALRRLEAGEWSLGSDDRTALIREIRAEIGYQERQERKKIAEEKEATDKDFFAKLHAETLQPGEVIASNLSRESKDYYMKALAKKKDPETDGRTFHKLFVGIEEGIKQPDGTVRAVDSDDLLEAHVGDKLRKEDMSLLLTRMYRVRGGKEPGSDWWFRIMRKQAEDKLQYNKQLERFVHPEGAENFFKGITQLMEEVERDGLKGKAIRVRGLEIFEPFFIDYDIKVLGKEVEPEEEKRKVFESLPPASEYAGQLLRDDDTGIFYESDGIEWTEVSFK